MQLIAKKSFRFGDGTVQLGDIFEADQRRAGRLIALGKASPVGANLSGLPVFIDHGRNADFPRPPDIERGLWLGWVKPEGMIRGDIWVIDNIFDIFDLTSKADWAAVAWIQSLFDADTEDGASISTWGDFTSTNQPIYRSSVEGLGHVPALEFNGSSHRMNTSDLEITDPYTVVFIGQLNNKTGISTIFESTGTGTRLDFRKRASNDGTTPNQLLIINGTDQLPGSVVDDNPFVAIYKSGPNPTLNVNGEVFTTGTAHTEGLAAVELGSRVGGGSRMNGWTPGAAIFEGTTSSNVDQLILEGAAAFCDFDLVV